MQLQRPTIGKAWSHTVSLWKRWRKIWCLHLSARFGTYVWVSTWDSISPQHWRRAFMTHGLQTTTRIAAYSYVMTTNSKQILGNTPRSTQKVSVLRGKFFLNLYKLQTAAFCSFPHLMLFMMARFWGSTQHGTIFPKRRAFWYCMLFAVAPLAYSATAISSRLEKTTISIPKGINDHGDPSLLWTQINRQIFLPFFFFFE